MSADSITNKLVSEGFRADDGLKMRRPSIVIFTLYLWISLTSCWLSVEFLLYNQQVYQLQVFVSWEK